MENDEIIDCQYQEQNGVHKEEESLLVFCRWKNSEEGAA